MDDQVTRLLDAVDQGDTAAAQQLLPQVYDELRKLAAARMAREPEGQTLQATALVHEAYLRLMGDDAARWESRGHYFAAAAEAMRRILIERARAKNRLKRGGGQWQRVAMEEVQLAIDTRPEVLLALDEALSQLEEEAPEKAQLVKLRYFVGMTIPEAATTMGISETTAKRHWKFARARLFQTLTTE
ncbi:MAG: ECF-type sigma factor [Verrucomicrobiota bacterium]